MENSITGQKFNKLTAIKFVEKRSKVAFWSFKCDCGKVIISNKHCVTNGSKISCGCHRSDIQHGNFRDLTGKRFNQITVIEKTRKATSSRAWKWLCRCDCGKEFEALGSNVRRGHTTSCGCRTRFQKAFKHPNWKGGTYIHANGYRLILVSDHPFAQKTGYIQEHRLVMEEKLNRYLLPHENVHHLNGVRDDNRPENLELWVTKQPFGQRPQDLIAYSLEILKQYAPQMLSVEGAYSFAV